MVTPHLTTTVEISADDTLGTEWDNGAIGKTNTLPSQAGSGSMFVNKMLKALPKNAADPKTAVSSSKPVAGGVSTVGLPAFGVSLLAFSPQGDYLAATEESMPRCLWVYRTSNLKLCALVVFQHGITSAQWRPTGSDEPWLIVTTGKMPRLLPCMSVITKSQPCLFLQGPQICTCGPPPTARRSSTAPPRRLLPR